MARLMSDEFPPSPARDEPRAKRAGNARLTGSFLNIYLTAVALAAAAAPALAQSDDRRDHDRISNFNPAPPRFPVAPSTPGFLRPITELRPVGGDLRPVAGDIRPVGGNLGQSASGIRPVEIGSPLANDRSFESRLRPHTTALGVTGFAIEPGWDDAPWTGEAAASDDRRGSSRRSSSAQSASASADSSNDDRFVAPAGLVVLRGRSSLSTASAARATADEPTPAAARSRRERDDNDADSTRRRSDKAPVPAPLSPAADDSEWFDLQPAAPARHRPVGDVRPDVRLAIRLTLQGRQHGAIETLRHAVYQQPEAFAGANGSLFDGDTSAQRRVQEAIEFYRDDRPARVSEADAAFMIAALSAARGEGDAAFEAIRAARALGEARASGKALHRVLSRGRVALVVAEKQP